MANLPIVLINLEEERNSDLLNLYCHFPLLKKTFSKKLSQTSKHNFEFSQIGFHNISVGHRHTVSTCYRAAVLLKYFIYLFK